MKQLSDERKMELGRGTGTGADYKPWITVREFSSSGVCSNPINWKTGRTAELLSKGETMAWYMSMYDETVTDIREQFPLLDTEAIGQICDKYGFRKPQRIFTTDLLITFNDGKELAMSVKPSRSKIIINDNDSEKTRRKKTSCLKRQVIEKEYWETYKGTKYMLAFADEFDFIYFRNIQICAPYYEEKSVFDEFSYIKHLIITHQINVNLSEKEINIEEILANMQQETVCIEEKQCRFNK